jgi:pyrroloquinoline quinone biosynthesis protein B
VFEDLTSGLPLLPALEHYCGVHWHVLPVAGEESEASFRIPALPGLALTALAIPGKAPPYSLHRSEQVAGDNIALLIEDLSDGRRLFYAPGLAEVGERELQWMCSADCLMVDGSFWEEGEMQRAGLSGKSASEMGHLPQSGSAARAGMVEVMQITPARRKVLIHINNSNPILEEGSEQRRVLESHGIEVAYDGMQITL